MSSSNASAGGVPPGFRFHPTDEELLQYYLKKKVSFQKFEMEVIKEVDLNKMEPWDLQERCRIGSTPQNEWYFFSHKDRKYPTGSRTNRATNMGFWKATGRDKCIRNGYKKIGMRKTLVFYRGRAPHGQKTDWIMHEYRLEDADDPNNNLTEDGWVVCRVFKKKNLFKIGGNNNESGAGSINTEQQHHHNLNNTFELNMLRDNHYSNFLPQHTNGHGLQPNPSTAFELNKPAELALDYSHHLQAPHSQYSLFPSQTLLATHPKPISGANGGGYAYPGMTSVAPTPLMVKQLMSTARDCESGDDDSFRYQNGELGTCEEPATHHRVITEGRDEGVNNNEWTTMLVSSHMTGAEDATNKDVARFDDSSASSVHQINNVHLRGEMDFWGYGNK